MSAQNLKEFREATGLTQRQFIDKLDIKDLKQAVYSNYETGVSNIPNDVLIAIANKLNGNVNWLLTGKGEMFEPELVIGKNHHPANHNGNGELVYIDVLELKASCGPGELLPEDVEIIKKFPLLKALLSPDLYGMKGCQARGDSMTPTIYHNDIVFYLPGDISGDGIYTIKKGCELICKRVNFRMDGSVIIKSDNDRYPPEDFKKYDDLFVIVGKVHGWVHLHRY